MNRGSIVVNMDRTRFVKKLLGELLGRRIWFWQRIANLDAVQVPGIRLADRTNRDSVQAAS